MNDDVELLMIFICGLSRLLDRLDVYGNEGASLPSAPLFGQLCFIAKQCVDRVTFPEKWFTYI